MVTAIVVKDAAEDPDCQRLRKQLYYLRLYVRLLHAAYWLVAIIDLYNYSSILGFFE